MEKTSYLQTEYKYLAPSAALLTPLPPMTIQMLKDGESMTYNYQFYKSAAKTCEARFNALTTWHKKAAKMQTIEAAVVK